MASIDFKYHEILRRILDEGIDKGDRTGTGTRSIFSHTLEYDMKEGFPLITTKKMFTKGIITELLWFLNGDTNLRYLLEHNNKIWVGDAYKKYKTQTEELNKCDTYKGDPTFVLSQDEFIERIKTNDEFNRQWGKLGPIYGKQWVEWNAWHTKPSGNINQIQQVIDALNNNPDSRRIMVSAWNPAEIDNMILPPCHWAFELYTEELSHDERISLWIKETGAGNWDSPYPSDIHLNEILDSDPSEEYLTSENIPLRKISLKWHQRSVDVPLGLPFNIASYAFLLEMFAQQVNMVPDKLIGDLTNVHIYQNQLDGVKEQLANDVNEHSAPTLKLTNSFEVDAGDNGERFYTDIFSYQLENFGIEDYTSYPTVKYPLSN